MYHLESRWRSPLPFVLVYHGPLQIATFFGSGKRHLLSLRCICKINHPFVKRPQKNEQRINLTLQKMPKKMHSKSTLPGMFVCYCCISKMYTFISPLFISTFEKPQVSRISFKKTASRTVEGRCDQGIWLDPGRAEETTHQPSTQTAFNGGSWGKTTSKSKKCHWILVV